MFVEETSGGYVRVEEEPDKRCGNAGDDSNHKEDQLPCGNFVRLDVTPGSLSYQ